MKAWYFSALDVLPNGDGRKIVVGETLKVKGRIVPCEHGLHASVSAYDALRYAPGPLLWRVELGGKIVPHSPHGGPTDKYAASERSTLAGGNDVSPALHEYARWCAFQVIHLWDPPDVVLEFIASGNERIREEASSAAYYAYAAPFKASDDTAYRACHAAASACYASAFSAFAQAAQHVAFMAAVQAAYAAPVGEKLRARFEDLCLSLTGNIT